MKQTKCDCDSAILISPMWNKQKSWVKETKYFYNVATK